MELQEFEKIYKETYDNTLKFIVIKCSHIEDVDDILQDTYVELFKKMKKQNVDIENMKSYIIGIAKNIIKRHYRTVKLKEKELPFEEINVEEDLLDDSFITKENAKEVLRYVRSQDIKTCKIFYLYFILGLKIKEISKEMAINESTVKTKLYRTIQEIRNLLGKEMK